VRSPYRRIRIYLLVVGCSSSARIGERKDQSCLVNSLV
jgi:uncharacterized protein YcfL